MSDGRLQDGPGTSEMKPSAAEYCVFKVAGGCCNHFGIIRRAQGRRTGAGLRYLVDCPKMALRRGGKGSGGKGRGAGLGCTTGDSRMVRGPPK